MSEWIKVEDGLPDEDKSIYFYNGIRVANGHYSMCYDYEKYDAESDTFPYSTQFQEYNAGYDGDSAPVYNVTHWQYEVIPEPPK